MTNSGLILTRSWRDDRDFLVLEFWLATLNGPQYIEIRGERPVFFVSRDEYAGSRHFRDAAQMRELALKDYKGSEVYGVYFNSWRRHQFAAKGLIESGSNPLEADIKPTERFLMERFIKGFVRWEGGTHDSLGGLRNPKLFAQDAVDVPLSIISFDIETDLDHQKVLSIAAVMTSGESKVWVVTSKKHSSYISCLSEAHCISQFIEFLQWQDPDIITGWNVIQFDLRLLQTRCDCLGIPFEIGRRKAEPSWREDQQGRHFVSISGRSVIDAMDGLKAAGFRFESFSLDFVAKAVLDRGKATEKNQSVKQLMHWYETDPVKFAHYNRVDAELVLAILERSKLIDYLVERSALTGAELHRIGGSVLQFDFMYLPLMHRAGFVAPRRGQRHYDYVSPGGFVMDSVPGLFSNVLVFDFKSLYPSIIRTFKVDPVAQWSVAEDTERIVEGFDGARFDAASAILPGIIDQLWSARDEAKRLGNQSASTALKIIMNSCYGVLGSSGCRFYDPSLSSSITKRGHEILQRTRTWLESLGWQVIYGDTDSVFVLLGDEINDPIKKGKSIQDELNRRWRQYINQKFSLASHLEIEFESCFKTFFMPTMRDQELGSKKRYAGLVVDETGEARLVSKGMESVRSDWTRFAKRVQVELFERVFYGHSWRDWLKAQVAGLYSGDFDQELVYQKRLRKPVEDYLKIIPPHVQAAKQCDPPMSRGSLVSYVVTINGVKNVQMRTHAGGLDYDHYREKQLAPAVDSLLLAMGTSLNDLVGAQLGLDF